MNHVVAVLNGLGQYLSKDEQMEEFLSKGFTLYLEENGKYEVLATPEEGFLKERPLLTKSITFKLKG